MAQRDSSQNAIEDACVNAATELLKEEQLPIRHARRSDMSSELPTAVRKALRLSKDTGRTTTELQARILTNERVSSIAQRLELPIAVVHTFETLFFDVRSRLTHSDWIDSAVIGPRVDAWHLRDVRQLLLTTAYHGGINAFEKLIEPFASTDWDSLTSSDFFDRRRSIPVEVRAYVAGKTTPIEQVPKLLHVWNWLNAVNPGLLQCTKQTASPAIGESALSQRKDAQSSAELHEQKSTALPIRKTKASRKLAKPKTRHGRKKAA